jgi:hypothetical protein
MLSAVYLVLPRRVSPFFRFSKLFHLAMILFLNPDFSFLNILFFRISVDPEKLLLALCFSSTISLSGSRLDRIWVGPDCSGFFLFLSGGLFLHQFTLLLSLARRTKICLYIHLLEQMYTIMLF